MGTSDESEASKAMSRARAALSKALKGGAIEGPAGLGVSPGFLEREQPGLLGESPAEWRIALEADGGRDVLAVDFDPEAGSPMAVSVGESLEAQGGLTWGISDLEASGGRCLITADLGEAVAARSSGCRAVYVLDESDGSYAAAVLGARARRGDRIVLAEALGHARAALEAQGARVSMEAEAPAVGEADLARFRQSELAYRLFGPQALGWDLGGAPGAVGDVGLRGDGRLAIRADGGGVLIVDPETGAFEADGADTWRADALRQGRDAPMVLVCQDPLDALALLGCRDAGTAWEVAWARSWADLAELGPTTPAVLVPHDPETDLAEDPEALKCMKAVGEVPEAAGAVTAPPVSVGEHEGGTSLAALRRDPDTPEMLEILVRRLTDGAREALYARTSAGYPWRLTNLRAEVLTAWGRDRKPIATGIRQLDEVLGGGLIPGGLYILGAASSLGKTTLALNIGLNIAQDLRDPRDVLYLTLEQDVPAMSAKIAARQSFLDWQCMEGRPDRVPPIQARDIQAGGLTPQDMAQTGRTDRVLRAMFGQDGEGGVPHLVLVRYDEDRPMEDGGPLNTRPGVDTAARHMAALERLTGRAPVLIADYLQILQPIDPRADAKVNLDMTIEALAALGARHHVPVLAIVSINRDSQLRNTQVKELNSASGSGNIEYRADAFMVLRKAAEQPWEGTKDPERPGLEYTYALDLNVRKNRMGPRGRAHLVHIAPYDLIRSDEGAAESLLGRDRSRAVLASDEALDRMDAEDDAVLSAVAKIRQDLTGTEAKAKAIAILRAQGVDVPEDYGQKKGSGNGGKSKAPEPSGTGGPRGHFRGDLRKNGNVRLIGARAR